MHTKPNHITHEAVQGPITGTHGAPKAPQEHKNTENMHCIMQTHEIICKNVLQHVNA